MRANLRARIRSPLRWLWTVLGSFSVIAAASLTGINWILLLLPAVWVIFLALPPILVFRHTETLAERASLSLDTTTGGQQSGYTDYRLVLRNNSGVVAESFSIRLRLPRDLSPPGHIIQPLGQLYVGTVGQNWFMETIDGRVVLTFRSARPASVPITIEAEQRMALCDLRFADGRAKKQPAFDFQISGGNAKTTLGKVQLKCPD